MTTEELEKMTVPELKARLKSNREVAKQLVGQLYPSVLEGENERIIEIIYKRRGW